MAWLGHAVLLAAVATLPPPTWATAAAPTQGPCCALAAMRAAFAPTGSATELDAAAELALWARRVAGTVAPLAEVQPAALRPVWEQNFSPCGVPDWTTDCVFDCTLRWLREYLFAPSSAGCPSKGHPSESIRQTPLKTDDAVSSSLTHSSSTSTSEVKDGRLLVNGHPSFRFGIYVYGLNASEWNTLKSAGYTTVLTYTNGCPDSPFDCPPNYTQAFLDNAAARDMKVILSLKDYYNYWSFAPSPKFEHEWRSTVSAFKHHPALLGWYLNDELGPSKVGFNASDLPAETPWTKTIDMLTIRNAAVKAADPAHVTNSIVNQWICSACHASGAWPRIDYMGVYLNTSDIFGVDPYAWKNQTACMSWAASQTDCPNLETEVDYVDALMKAYGPGAGATRRATMCASQIYDYGATSPEGTSLYSEPSFAVKRAMTWLLPISGCGGILHYDWRAQFVQSENRTAKTVVKANSSTVARRLDEMRAIGQELEPHLGLLATGEWRQLNTSKYVHAAWFAPAAESDAGLGWMFIVNSRGISRSVNVMAGSCNVSRTLEPWAVAKVDLRSECSRPARVGPSTMSADDTAGMDRVPILNGNCQNGSAILSQFTAAPADGSLYVAVRHMGAPGSAELLGEVARPVTWDVGAVSGVPVPAARRASTQRGYRDQEGHNAFQLDCRSFGSFINTSSFNHSAAIRGGGENVVYTAAFPASTAPRPWSGGAGTRLVLEALVGVATMELAPAPSGSPGVGQLSFGFYLHDGSSGKTFCFILQIFDSRRFGVGNGAEFIASDTFTPFVSSPLVKGMNYSTVCDRSATLQNASPFGEQRFCVSVSSEQLGAAISAVNSRFAGTDLGTDLGKYRLTSVMILHEVLLVAATDPRNNVNMGVGVQNFSVSADMYVHV
jgi:hypothetical protein